MLQSVIFDKKYFTLKQVLKYLDEYYPNTIKVDITKNLYRARQIEPIKNKHYFIRSSTKTKGIKYVIMI